MPSKHHHKRRRRHKKSAPLTTKQKIARYTLLTFLVGMMLLSLSLGLSSVIAQGPHNLLNEWETNKKVGTENEWNSALKLLKTANSLNPLDAQIYFDMGRLYHWKGKQHNVWEQPFKDNMNTAEQYYKEALEQRPTWGLAWVYLADVMIGSQKASKGGVDALKMGIDIEPFGQWVSGRLLELSLTVWPLLDGNYHCVLFEMMAYRNTFYGRYQIYGKARRDKLLTSIANNTGGIDQLISRSSYIKEETHRMANYSLGDKLHFMFSYNSKWLPGVCNDW